MSRSDRRRIGAPLLAAGVMLCFLAPLSTARGADPAPQQQVDDQLLKDLNRQLSGKASDGPADVGHPQAQVPEKATDSTTAAADRPSSSGSTPRPVDSLAPSAKAASPESTDEKLLKDLDRGDEKGLAPHAGQSPDELGDDVDPLTRIGTKMRRAESLIDRDKLSDKTVRLQDEIIHDIDLLMKQVRKQAQQQPATADKSPSGKSPRLQVAVQRSTVQQPGQQRTGPQQQPICPDPKVAGNGDSKKPALGSQGGIRKTPKNKIDPAALNDLLTKVWRVDLPDKDREQMRQGASEKFLPKYEDQVIKYFRRLAEESESSR